MPADGMNAAAEKRTSACPNCGSSVEQAAKVDLVLNFKTAKTLGITVPLPISGRADEIIE
jgi:hypothetical protein